MAYRFENDESVEAGFRRIAGEQVAKIIARLGKDRNGETTIHESRKSLKRLRALLWLVRKGLGKKEYRREYDMVRDVGRLLSGARDFEVMPKTLAVLAAGADGIDKTAVRQIDAAIARAKGGFEQAWDRDAAIETVLEELGDAQKRIGRLDVAGGFGMLAAGAGRCLGEVRADGAVALATAEDEAYHEWRKSVQRHWRHLRLLQGVWPEMMTARITVTRALADVLGLDHDLAVLAQFIHDVPGNRLKTERRQSLIEAVSARQLALRVEARAYAGLIIADEPDAFADRLEAYRAAQGRIAALERPAAELQGSGSAE